MQRFPQKKRNHFKLVSISQSYHFNLIINNNDNNNDGTNNNNSNIFLLYFLSVPFYKTMYVNDSKRYKMCSVEYNNIHSFIYWGSSYLHLIFVTYFWSLEISDYIMLIFYFLVYVPSIVFIQHFIKLMIIWLYIGWVSECKEKLQHVMINHVIYYTSQLFSDEISFLRLKL